MWFLIGMIIFGAILSWYPYYWWLGRTVKNVFKGPRAHPLIGTLHHFRDLRNVLSTMRYLHSTYGKTYIGFVIFDMFYVTCDAEFIAFIMMNTKTLNKGWVYTFLTRWLGTGLLTSSTEKWQKRRKLITPAYHFHVLDQSVEIIDGNVDIMIYALKQEVDKEYVNIHSFVNLCALDIICETAMGTKVNAQLNSHSAFVQATKQMNRIILARALQLGKRIESTYRFTDDYRKEIEALKIIHGYTTNLIESRRNELIKTKEQTGSGHVKDEPLVIKRKDNFLDLLLKSSIDGKSLSNDDIREEVDTFAFEGHDTVTSAISFALYLISQNPEEQDRLIEEQRHIFGEDPQRPTTLHDLQEMCYLGLVIKETLRLYPSVPFIVREATEDVYFKQVKIVKNSQIVINVHHLHRDPKVFPDPEKFLPDRFLPNAQTASHPFSYIPFSAGFRNCIGQKFAILEMKSVISKVLRNFVLLPAPPHCEPFVVAEVILHSENGVSVKLKNRIWQF